MHPETISLHSSRSKEAVKWVLAGCLPQSRVLTSIPVTSPTFVVGRHPNTDLQLTSFCVSGRHAELLRIGDHLFVRDLGSTNGTFLNRRRVRQPTPVAVGDHLEFADVEFRVQLAQPEAPPDLQALKKTDQVIEAMEDDWILSNFHELLSSRALIPYFQKLVDLKTLQTFGYEALARSELKGLENPGQMFQTARTMNQEVELSLLCRERAVETAEWAGDAKIFVNTHPTESLERDLLPSVFELREKYPQIGLVIEIHESAIDDIDDTRRAVEQLRDHGVEVAYDDFGAGQARLLELVQCPPDYLKFDRKLIANIHACIPQHLRMVSMLISIAQDVGIKTLAEGIELAAEANVCKDLGFDLAQGYYYGRPQCAEDCSTTSKLSKSQTLRISNS